jgi:mycothiol synthase
MNDFTSAVTSFFTVGRTLEFTLDDLPGPLSDADAAAVRDLASDAEANDEVAPLSEQPLLWLQDSDAPVRHVLARATADSRGPELLAYAQLDLGAPTRAAAELVVHPLVRRRGIGLAVLSRVGHLAESRERALALWAHGDLPAARRLASSAGLVVERELWRMERRLPGPDELADAGLAPGDAPDGVTARDFVPGSDDAAWVTVNSEVFADHPEQGRVNVADLRARQDEEWFDPHGFVLATTGGSEHDEIVGYCWTKVTADAPRTGEIYVLGVAAVARGTGLGGWLLREGLRRLAERGVTTVELYVDGDNTGATAVYERAGFHRASSDVQLAQPTAGDGPRARS